MADLYGSLPILKSQWAKGSNIIPYWHRPFSVLNRNWQGEIVYGMW